MVWASSRVEGGSRVAVQPRSLSSGVGMLMGPMGLIGELGQFVFFVFNSLSP